MQDLKEVIAQRNREQNDPRWAGWTTSLECVPDIMKDGYEWVETQDKWGKYYVARRINEILRDTTRKSE